MAVITMAKRAGEKKSGLGSSADKTTITCRREDRDLLARVAGLRGETLEEFLGSSILREFLHHVMIEEVRKQTEKKG